MLHQLIFGLLLGWGAAIPLGPMNLEMIRRNLHFGTIYGVALGAGACSADLTYLFLLALGALTILTHHLILQVVGFVGSCILLWFGYSALKLETIPLNNALDQKLNAKAPSHHLMEGYVLTLLNPFTILFWASVSTQIAIMAKSTIYAIWYAGLGVLLGTLSWIIVLNSGLHFTRHRLSPPVMQWINRIGGLMLISFALLGFWRSWS